MLLSYTQTVSELLKESLKFSSSQKLCILKIIYFSTNCFKALRYEILNTVNPPPYVLKNILTIELFAYQINGNGRCEYFHKFFDYFQSVECFSMHSLKVDGPYFVSNANSTNFIGRTSRNDVSYFH